MSEFFKRKCDFCGTEVTWDDRPLGWIILCGNLPAGSVGSPTFELKVNSRQGTVVPRSFKSVDFCGESCMVDWITTQTTELFKS